MTAARNCVLTSINQCFAISLFDKKKELMHYFPDVTSCAYCINPFFVDPADLPVGTGEEEELIDIQTDEAAKITHKECGCSINFG